MNKDISNLNFITSWGIKESSTPHCELTIVSGAEVLEKLIVDDTMLDGKPWMTGYLLICRIGSLGQQSGQGGGGVHESWIQAERAAHDGRAAR